nr:hypothetical protein [Tanacetum cinerariifolium]
DNYGGSHETFQCQPITFQIDFSGSDQIQTPQYPEIQFSSQETSDKVFQANHSVQNEESSNEIAILNSNQEKEEPPQDSDICQLIRDECSTEVSEEQKQSMEETMLELVKICQEKEFLCIHDDIDDLIEGALNSKLLLINSNYQRLDKKEQEVKNVVEQPAEQPEHLLSMGYKHLIITPETKSDEVTESNAKNLLPIPSECEVALEDKREFYDDDFKDVEYVEASFPDPEIVSVDEENVVQQEEEEVDFEDISQIQDIVFNDILDDLTNDPLLEEVDLFLDADHSIPLGIENFYDSEGDIRFLEALLIDDSILSQESSDSNFEDNISIPRPPPESPDTKTDAGEEIPVVMNDKDEDVYSSFIFVIFAKMFSLLSAESEDIIFDPGISD